MSSTTPDPTASTEPLDEEGDFFGGSPIWVAIPLVLFVIATVLVSCIIFWRRRRGLGTSLHANWGPVDHHHYHYRRPYADPTLQPTGVPLYGRRTGWTGWASRISEGLNEFGEAPPAYEAKPQEPAQSLAGATNHPGPSGAGATAAVELDEIHRPTANRGAPTATVDTSADLALNSSGPASPLTPLTPPAPTHRPGAWSSTLAPPGPVPPVPPPDYASPTSTAPSTTTSTHSSTTPGAPRPEPPPPSVPVIQSPLPTAPRAP